MAVFSERVQIFIDFIEQKTGGKSALGTTLQDIKSAEGGLGKLKAATSGVGQAIGSLGWAGLAAGASAAAVAAAKMVDKFEDLALAAGKFGDATGLSTENASRWMEVAGDLGIGVDQVQTAFAKLNSVAQSSPDKLEKYGASVVKAKDGTVDLQATILNVIGALNNLDPSARAAAMKDIFGKGAVGAAELFNMSVSDIKKNLADVSDAKLIDPDEERKAKQLRDATQDIGDAWEDIQLNIGGTLADMSGFVRLIADAVSKAQELNEKIKDWSGGAIDLFVGGLTGLGRAWNKIKGNSDEATEAQTGGLKKVFSFAQDAIGSIEGIGNAYDSLMGKLDAESQALNIADDFDRVKQSAVEAWDATASGAEDAASKVRDNQRAVIDLKKDIAEYATKVLGLPDQEVTEILALIDQGSVDEANRKLNDAAKTRTATIQVQAVLTNILKKSTFGLGGTTASASSAAAAQLLGASPQGSVSPTVASQGITVGLPVVASAPITKVDIHMPPAAQPSAVVAAIQRWAHRNGSLANAGVRSG